VAGAVVEAMTPSIVALIPARSGSVRVPHKNIRPLAGHPLLAYTIAAARQSGVFADVIVSTDSEEYAEIARRYGAKVVICPTTVAHRSDTPDILWVQHALAVVKAPECFSILRPTSPFRQTSAIVLAWESFCQANEDYRVDSLRAVEVAKQHPGKMWRRLQPRWGRKCDLMVPLMPWYEIEVPWHSSQTANLPEVWVQNASLEIAWTDVPLKMDSIAGQIVMPWFSKGYEGFDINTPDDFLFAEFLVERGLATLPKVER
jgi:N-acylneuraminate cytidylyltransferase